VFAVNVIELTVAPLAIARDEILPLARRFLLLLARRPEAPPSCRRKRTRAARYPWPGNVRELRNANREAVIYCRRGVALRSVSRPHPQQRPIRPSWAETYTTKPMEREHILRVLGRSKTQEEAAGSRPRRLHAVAQHASNEDG